MEEKTLFRLFFVLTIAGVFLATSYGASEPEKKGLCLFGCRLRKRLERLERQVKDLTKRVDGANVQCIAKFTNFDEGAYKALVFLDRQNVACPKDYFLASFQLNRQNDRKSSKIRYSYQCCKFVL